ncbi:AarF/ABC1/UbiB kinase family protein [Candidatus Woesearchaeota archaeon]|nr:AarF/ABC1/UbiB kinase family protein [Candidatus Woesearchaeota archaeon]
MSFGQNFKDFKRFEQIVRVFLKNGFGVYLSKFGLIKKLPLARKISPIKTNEPVKLRKCFEQLGGTFVKLGQLLSLRPDLIPKEYADELAKLQDKVAPFDVKLVKKIISQECGKSLSEVFSRFDEKPLAAASIAQVHRARLKTGEEVVLKVRRPNVEELFETDIDILEKVAKYLTKKYHPELIDPQEIIEEFKGYTLKELDFEHEAQNIEEFSKNFKGDATTKIPQVFRDYTSKKVLCMQYIEGVKVSNKRELIKKHYNPKKIVSNITYSIFKQIFVHGVFHADPHPGNILVIKNNRVVFLDFGIVGRLTGSVRAKTTNLFTALITRDKELIGDAMLDLGLLEEGFNREDFNDDLSDTLSKYYDVEIQNIIISELFYDLLNFAGRNSIQLPANFVLLGKTLSTVEGFGSKLDPHFNLIKTCKPFAMRLIRQRKNLKTLLHDSRLAAHRTKRFLSSFPDSASEFLRRVKSADDDLREMHQDLKIVNYNMETSSNRLTLAMLITAFLVSSSVLLSYEKILAYIGFSFAGLLFLLFLYSYTHKKDNFR